MSTSSSLAAPPLLDVIRDELDRRFGPNSPHARLSLLTLLSSATRYPLALRLVGTSLVELIRIAQAAVDLLPEGHADFIARWPSKQPGNGAAVFHPDALDRAVRDVLLAEHVQWLCGELSSAEASAGNRQARPVVFVELTLEEPGSETPTAQQALLKAHLNTSVAPIECGLAAIGAAQPLQASADWQELRRRLRSRVGQLNARRVLLPSLDRLAPAAKPPHLVGRLLQVAALACNLALLRDESLASGSVLHATDGDLTAALELAQVLDDDRPVLPQYVLDFLDNLRRMDGVKLPNGQGLTLEQIQRFLQDKVGGQDWTERMVGYRLAALKDAGLADRTIGAKPYRWFLRPLADGYQKDSIYIRMNQAFKKSSMQQVPTSSDTWGASELRQDQSVSCTIPKPV